MKATHMIFVLVCLLQILVAKENEALPEIPALNIEPTKEQSNPPKPQNVTQESPQESAINSIKQESTKESVAQGSTEASKSVELPISNESNATNPALIPTEENNATRKERDPFTPIITPKDSGQITNAPQLNLFTKTELILPSTARKIKKITLEYQNLNGSITAMEQELDGDIDWHFPLVLHQEVQPKAPDIPNKQEFSLGDKFHFELKRKDILLHTDFKLLRTFTLASPSRLILDFKSPNKQPLKDSIATKIPTIPQVDLGTHLDFYRITLSLDGQYKYNLTQDTSAGQYTIELY